jgi:hypothetical protein
MKAAELDQSGQFVEAARVIIGLDAPQQSSAA